MNTELKPGERDAIHVPIITLIAHKALLPGEPIGVNGKATTDGDVGIVDPFVSRVNVNQVVDVWLEPGSTGKVRHAWSHSSLPEDVSPSPPKAESLTAEEWGDHLKRFADEAEVSLRALEDAAMHIVKYGSSSGGNQPDWNDSEDIDWEDFWGKFNLRFGTSVISDTDPFCC